MDRTRLYRAVGRPCTVPGCGRKSDGARRLCAKHRTHRDRHGHELQSGVRTGELTPIKKWIRAWIRSRANGDKIWQGILADWQRCRDDALTGLREMQQPGRAGYSWMRDALRDIVEVGSDADPEAVFLTVMAVVLLHEQDPRRFKDHRALLFQVSRRFRSLSARNRKTWNKSHNGEPRFCYTTPSPRHAAVVGETLLHAIGAHAVAIHNRWATEIAQKQAARQATLEAINTNEGEVLT